jgi:Uncharacterised nucleotidyltransferase
MIAESSRARLLSRALCRSWRAVPDETAPMSVAEFNAVTPLLYDSGAAGLGWWRIRNSELATTPNGALLHQAFRLLSLHGRIHETKIVKVVRALRAAQIDPILIKGWAIARLYPQLGLRPYGDIDLLIRPAQHSAAIQIAAREDLGDCLIDLQPRPSELADRSIENLFSCSRFIQCGDEQVRVLGDEDHFALLAVHLLKHGAWRPLWLCDLGLLLESMSSTFDWDLCLGTQKHRTNWILSAIDLTRKLLDASIGDESISARANAPAWLVESVLKNWAAPYAAAHGALGHRAPIKSYLRSPDGLFNDLARRWPDPILATISVNGSFGSRHRKRYQLQNCLQRATRLVLRGSEVS